MFKLKIWIVIFLFVICGIPGSALASLPTKQDATSSDIQAYTDFLEIGYVFADQEPIALVLTRVKDSELEQTIDYYPFGNLRFNEQRVQNESFDEQRKFTGHEYDYESRLTYMGARYYQGDAGQSL